MFRSKRNRVSDVIVGFGFLTLLGIFGFSWSVPVGLAAMAVGFVSYNPKKILKQLAPFLIGALVMALTYNLLQLSTSPWVQAVTAITVPAALFAYLDYKHNDQPPAVLGDAQVAPNTTRPQLCNQEPTSPESPGAANKPDSDNSGRSLFGEPPAPGKGSRPQDGFSHDKSTGPGKGPDSPRLGW